ncbi:hypothetical protein DKP76_11710 [Falsochrobactrum shanghaiense]|uniref:Uncharacterized protein n=1 Tax=Falsochrobactrum shanghaiense TaxID=2201899 RepID=A0A316J6F4_9HYPH|nr:hypothetical protein [Falsochrobactrum shanghaiense]PWL17437.1 hypothetical protein DKP76_11710 [Falsochrobactrum shanghaiense]
MASKELIEKVERAIGNSGYQNYPLAMVHTVIAKAAISTIYAALQEPNANQEQSGMREIMGGTGYVNHEIYIDPETPWHTWRAMLAASALGEQSE